jgi:hypothetical protein
MPMPMPRPDAEAGAEVGCSEAVPDAADAGVIGCRVPDRMPV